jgi:hypothetical protein
MVMRAISSGGLSALVDHQVVLLGGVVIVESPNRYHITVRGVKMDIRLQEAIDLCEVSQGWLWCQQCDAVGVWCVICGKLFLEGAIVLIAYHSPNSIVPEGSVCRDCLAGGEAAIRKRMQIQAAYLREQADTLERAADDPLFAPSLREWHQAIVTVFPRQLPPFSTEELRQMLRGMETEIELALTENPDEFAHLMDLRNLLVAEIGRRISTTGGKTPQDGC